MSQQTTLPTPKGLSKTTVTIIVTLLLSILAFSLFFNVLSYTTNQHPTVDVQMSGLEWTQYKVATENNLYLVVGNLTLQNSDPRWDEIDVSYIMYGSTGGLIFESISANSPITPPVSYAAAYMLPPNRTVICGFSFLYLNQQNETTHINAEIVGKIPIV